MKPVFFATQSDLRKWFEKNYKTKTELIVGYYKVSTGKPSIIWSQSVDQAICFGWIDGIRRSIDKNSYCIRFTPRNPKSAWSAINIKKATELTMLGLMTPEGITAFGKRKENKSACEFPEDYMNQLRKNKKAWKFFDSQTPSYQRIVIRWVMSAKQEKTKINRLKTLITDCAAGEKIKPMRVGPKK
jgi:uncharacterized protein YdeI (YjbR/CyaY-like superfamily)